MRSMRNLVVLAALTLAAVLGAWYGQRPHAAIPLAGEALFPGLIERVNDVDRIEVERRGERFTLAREGGSWQVVEKDGYAADPELVRALLLGAARLTRVEPKTARPESYPRLGLGDPQQQGSKSTRFVLKNAVGASIADLVLGEQRFGKGDPGVDEYFVRMPPEPRAWLVEGKLPIARALGDWLDKQIAEIARGRVRTVEITHADGERVAVERGRDEDSYRLRELPAGRKVDGDWKVDDIGRLFEDLKLDDVEPADASRFEQAERGARVVLSTYDGLRVTLDTARDGERTLARLEAAYVPELASAAGAANAADGEDAGGAQEAGEAQGEQQRKADDEPTVLLGPEQVSEEAARLTARWKPWIYVLPSFKAGYIGQRMEDLLAKAEPPTPNPVPVQD